MRERKKKHRIMVTIQNLGKQQNKWLEKVHKNGKESTNRDNEWCCWMCMATGNIFTAPSLSFLPSL